jgi:hypothetical protein
MRGILASLMAFACAQLVAGCADTLVYGERTSFDLAIGVNEAIALPISVNAGFHRTAAALVPPREGVVRSPDGKTVAKGEAVSMISGFRLAYAEDDASLFGGKLTIQSQFASGFAAIDVSRNPQVAALIARGRTLLPAAFHDRRVSLDDYVQRKSRTDPDRVMELARRLNRPAQDAGTAWEHVHDAIMATRTEAELAKLEAQIEAVLGGGA